MRGLSVNRPLRRREKTRKIRRGRPLRRRRADVQTAGRQPSKDGLFASVQLLGREFYGVPPRRRVDKREKPFLVARGGIVVAILCADIDRWRFRQAAAGENIVEFGAVILREEHIVMDERRAPGARPHRKRHRRERRLRIRAAAGGVLRLTAEQAAAQRRDIAVHDNGVGLEHFAVSEQDAAGPSP